MSHRPAIWMPMYWSDYLGDTSHLTTIEHGAYLLLIAHYWITGRPLPNDDKRLSQITKMGTKKWRGMRQTIEVLFTISGDVWTHSRVDEEIAKAIENKEKNRKRTENATASRRNVTTNVTSTPSPSPSPSPVVRKDSVIGKPKSSKLSLDWSPTDEYKKYAAEYGFVGKQYFDLNEGFHEYWTNGNGRGKTKLDWFRTYQTWVRNQSPPRVHKRSRSLGGDEGPTSFAQAASDVLNQMGERPDKSNAEGLRGDWQQGTGGDVIEGDLTTSAEGNSTEGFN